MQAARGEIQRGKKLISKQLFFKSSELKMNLAANVVKWGGLLALTLVIANCGPGKNRIGQNGSSVLMTDQSGFDFDSMNSIVGGVAVGTEEAIAASTVNFYYTMDNQKAMNFCTGTLIGPDIVLTAAHCFANVAEQQRITVEEFARSVRVGFGTDVVDSLSNSKVEFREIAVVKVHQDYKTDSVRRAAKVPMMDIALVKISAPAPATAKVVPMVEDKSRLVKGLKLTLAGFGLLDFGARKKATQLMKVDIIVDHPDFSATQFTYTNVGGHSACSGDSGGPAYLVDDKGGLEVIGVTSWGDRDCQQLGAYTSVPAFGPWIQENLASLNNTQ